MSTRTYKTKSQHLLVEGTGWNGKSKRLDISLRARPVPCSRKDVEPELLGDFEWVDCISVVTIERDIQETKTREPLT